MWSGQYLELGPSNGMLSNEREGLLESCHASCRLCIQRGTGHSSLAATPSGDPGLECGDILADMPVGRVAVLDCVVTCPAALRGFSVYKGNQKGERVECNFSPHFT